jgi:hypothetical protein
MDLENIVRGHGLELAHHAERITACETREHETSAKLDKLLWLMLTTLIATVGVLLRLVLKSA